MNTTTKPDTANYNKPLDLSRCCADVANHAYSRYPQRCKNRASHFDQDRSRVSYVFEKFVGERTELDILMGVDNRDRKLETVWVEGPVQPLPFCGTHSPAKKAAKRRAEYEAAEKQYEAREKARRTYAELAGELTLLLDAAAYEVQVNTVRGHDNTYRDNGILLSGKIARQLIERLKGGSND